MGTILAFRGRGRPESDLAITMHVTALALDNVQWDSAERGLLEAAHQLVTHIACNADADHDSRTQAGRAALLLAELIAGDQAEDDRHARQVRHLRVLNGRLDEARPAADTAGLPGAS